MWLCGPQTCYSRAIFEACGPAGRAVPLPVTIWSQANNLRWGVDWKVLSCRGPAKSVRHSDSHIALGGVGRRVNSGVLQSVGRDSRPRRGSLHGLAGSSLLAWLTWLIT